MFDVVLPHDPRLDVGVLLDRVARRYPRRYFLELDVLRQSRLERAMSGTVLIAKIARNALVALSVRVKHDENAARTRLVMRPIIASRRMRLLLAPIMVVLYPLLALLALAIRSDVREALRPLPTPVDPPPTAPRPDAPASKRRTIVRPAFAACATDAYAPTVPYAPLRRASDDRITPPLGI